MTSPMFDQTAFQGYADDDVPGSATVKGIVGADWTQLVNESFRVRYAVDEYNSKAASNKTFIWEVNYDGAGFVDITTVSTIVKVVTTTHYTDEDADNNQRVGAGTFEGGVLDDDGTVGENSQIDYTADNEWEIESCFQIVSGGVADTKTMVLRVKDLTAYTEAGPTITVNKPAAEAADTNMLLMGVG